MTADIPPGSQTGDITRRDAAGRDLYQGLTGDQLMQALERQQEFYLSLTAAYERTATGLAQKLERVRDEQDMLRASLDARRDAERREREAERRAEQEERTRRQRKLDRQLLTIAAVLFVLTLLVLRLI